MPTGKTQTCPNLPVGFLRQIRPSDLNRADQDLLEAAGIEGNPALLDCQELNHLPPDRWNHFDSRFAMDRREVAAKYLKRREATYQFGKRFLADAYPEEVREFLGEKYCHFLSLLPLSQNHDAFLQGAMTCSRLYLGDEEADKAVVRQFTEELEKGSESHFARQAYLFLAQAGANHFSPEAINALPRHFGSIYKTLDETQTLDLIRSFGKILEKRPEGKMATLLLAVAANPSQFSEEARATAVYELSRSGQDPFALRGIHSLLSRHLARERSPLVRRELAATLEIFEARINGGPQRMGEVENRIGRLNFIHEPSPVKRSEAARALGALRNPQERALALPALLSSMQTQWEPDDSVREEAILALGNLGETAVILPVVWMLFARMRDEEEAGNVRLAAALSLGKLGASLASEEALQEYEKRTKEIAIRGDTEAAEGKAVWALGFLLRRVKSALLVRFLLDLAERKKNSAPFVRGEALFSLLALVKGPAGEKLFSVFAGCLDQKSEPSEYVRVKAVAILREISHRSQDPRILPVLSSRLDPRKEPSEWVREEAIQALRGFGRETLTPETVQKLEAISKNEKGIFSEEVSNAALELLEGWREEET